MGNPSTTLANETAMNVVEVADLLKDYPGAEEPVRVLKGVTFTIRVGEFVSLMGPSGSGKSTLLNVLGCLDQATAGAYRLEGRDLTSLDDAALSRIRNERIGFIFQSFNLLNASTIQRNVELPLVYARANRARRREVVSNLLERVGLGHRLDHRPPQLSGGEQQRVAIARALTNDPAILLADEPTGNLDSERGTQILSLLQELNRTGMTILMVTHDLRIADYTHRVLRMKDGILAEDVPIESPLDAREHPLS